MSSQDIDAGGSEPEGSKIAEDTSFDWQLRPVITALVLALCGLAVFFALEDKPSYDDPIVPWRQAVAAFFFFGGLAACFSLERIRWLWSIIFGLIAGLVLAGITYWVAGYGERGFEWNWAFGAGLIALAIATPLFQTFRDEGQRRFPYPRLHFHAWTDVVIYFASLAFVGLSWLLLLLLAGLFDLIGIDFIKNIMREAWFGWTFSGLTFGAALGILRESDKVLGTLQRVVLIVLSVLAPPLATGLSVFLVLLLFTGLDTLWDATDATTPILLSCAIGAVILSNAVIRNDRSETSPSLILQGSALVLALNILPLALIAAVSMGLRIDQYGLTPERAWGLLVVVIATAYGLAYLVSVARKRMDWAEIVRPANTRLAMALCAICLILAMPIADFGAMSARDQMARLQNGDVSADEFDYVAFAFDFGPKGREMLKMLANGKAAASTLAPEDKRLAMNHASKALASNNRWAAYEGRESALSGRSLDQFLQVLPTGATLPDGLRKALQDNSACREKACLVYIESPARAVFVERSCDNCLPNTSIYTKGDGMDWDRDWSVDWRNAEKDYWQNRDIEKLDANSKIEVRDVPKKQIFVDGKPYSTPF